MPLEIVSRATLENKTRDDNCPEIVTAILQYLSDELCRVMWNKTQKEYQSPFGNYGAEYKNDTFEVRSYYWGDDEEEAEKPNFKWRDVEISWYKYLGRGMYSDKKITLTTLEKMFYECLESIRKEEECESW